MKEILDKNFEFQVNDEVEAFGYSGFVSEYSSHDYPIQVYLKEADKTEMFTLDGRHYTWHKTPSLKLINRPKKKVKKKLEGWVNVYPNCIGDTFGKTKEHANSSSSYNRIACVYVSGEYEVEE